MKFCSTPVQVNAEKTKDAYRVSSQDVKQNESKKINSDSQSDIGQIFWNTTTK